MDNLTTVSLAIQLFWLKLMLFHFLKRRPLKDTVCLNAFNKFEATITKKFEKQLEGFTEVELRELEELTELFEFLDSIIPLDDDDDEYFDVEPRKKGKKRYVVLSRNCYRGNMIYGVSGVPIALQAPMKVDPSLLSH